MTLLTIADAAAKLGVSPGTIRNLEKRGELHPVRIGRTVKIKATELRHMIRNRPDAAVTEV